MNFGDALRSHVACHEGLSILDGEPCVVQSALVGAASGVTDDDRQEVDGEVIKIGAVESAQEREPAVAAAQVEHDRSGSAEDRPPVEWAKLQAAV